MSAGRAPSGRDRAGADRAGGDGTGPAGGGRAGSGRARSGRDWAAWHDAYDDPGSPLSQRLLAVQAWIAAALDQAPPGRLRAVSICAGQGRDLIGVLRDHPRRGDVTARLVERDPRIAAAASQLAADAGLTQVEVVTGDAAQTDVYAGLVPANLVLACGVFGNITNEDVARTIRCCAVCARRAARWSGPAGDLSPTWSRRSANGSLRKTSSYWGCPSGRPGGELVRTGLPEPLPRCPPGSGCSPSPGPTC